MKQDWGEEGQTVMHLQQKPQGPVTLVGISEAGLVLQSCPELGLEIWPFYTCSDKSWHVGGPRE